MDAIQKMRIDRSTAVPQAETPRMWDRPAGGTASSGDAMYWDDSTPMFWDDVSPMIWS